MGIKRAFKTFIVSCVEQAIDNVLNRRTQHNIESLAYFMASIDSARYLTKNMPMVSNFMTKSALLNHVLEHISAKGLILEFGVYKGDSLLNIAYQTDRTVYGFDSFEGVPEDWTHSQKKGRFSTDGELPSVTADNIEFVKGWFADTIPPFLKRHEDDVAFIHIDCDIYPSTKTVLTMFTGRIKPGTVLLFDEFFNYPGWQRHEVRAFDEFINDTGYSFEYLGFVSTDCSVAIKIRESS